MIGFNILSGEFLRDDTLEVVRDTKTNLMWQDNSDASNTSYRWEEAIEFCQNLSFSGYNDWRLPNINELLSIVDDTKYSPAIIEVFTNTRSSYYWSATTSAHDKSNAWDVYFYYGSSGYSNKSNSRYVRCVRGGQ
jgi:hypothetical protein